MIHVYWLVGKNRKNRLVFVEVARKNAIFFTMSVVWIHIFLLSGGFLFIFAEKSSLEQKMDFFV